MTDSFDPPGVAPFAISGKVVWIADTSGFPIETQLFSGERFVKAWISGQAVQTNVVVQISGVTATISVSGNPVLTSGQVAQISGQTVYAVSGKAFNYGFDPSGQTWNELYVDRSGGHILQIAGSFTANVSGQPVQISGQTVVANVVTNISGQTIYLASGQNSVQISGQLVAVSGLVSTSVSGNAIRVSGAVFYPVSGFAFNLGFDPSGVTWNEFWVDASGSHRQLVAISGQTVTAKISGETISIAGGINVSGSAVRISGETVYPVSGKSLTYGFDQSGATWNEIFVDTSGGHRLKVAMSGETVSIAGGINVSGSAVRISGETIYLASGKNDVQISGQTIQIAGGVSVSGNMVSISGQPIAGSVSGNAVRISGETVSIAGGVSVSGNVVYLISGQNEVAAFGLIDASGQLTRLRVTQSGQTISGIPHKLVVTFSGDSIIGSVSGNMVSVSGQAIAVSGQAVLISGQTVVANVVTNISGQTVYLASGQNSVQISGQLVAVSGLVATSVSGNMVSISGQPVSVSGNVVVASVTTNISGQTVYFASGQNEVAAFGFIDASGQLTRLRMTQSGQTISGIPHKLVVTFSGDSIIGSVSGNMVSVSGQAIAVSGQAVLISGQTVVANVVTNISGQTVYLTSGQNEVAAFGLIDSSGQLTRLRMTQSGQTISGIPHKLVVTFSGDSIIGSVSGNMVSVSGQPITVSGNAVRVSGETVQIAGGVSVSGNVVYLVSGQNPVAAFGLIDASGELTRLRMTQSGQTISGIPHKLVVTFSGDSIIGSVSGNAVLVSGQLVAVSGVVAANVSGNVVYLTSGQNAISNFGFMDSSGQLIALRMTMSGQTISGIPHKLVVTFSGDSIIGSVSGNAVSVSGNMVSTSGQPSPVSGQIVYLTSGQNDVSTFGFMDSSGQLTRLRMTMSGQTISGIPHKLVVTFSGDSIIGSVSGNAVSVSGNMVSTSGQPSPISGQIVYTTSGFNEVGAFGFVEESGQFKALRSTSSGKGISGIPHRLVVAFSGDLVQIGSPGAGPAEVSSNLYNDAMSQNVSPLATATAIHAYDGVANQWPRVRVATSGKSISVISGQPYYVLTTNAMWDPSGQQWVEPWTNASGDHSMKTSQTVNVTTNVSGQLVSVSGGIATAIGGTPTSTIWADVQSNTNADDVSTGVSALDVQAINYGFDESLGQFSRLRVTSSGKQISGQAYKLVVAFSGDSIHIGGETTTAIAVVDSRSFDDGGTGDEALYTIANMYGLESSLGQWARLRVTSSGKNISGIAHKLVVAFSGDIVRIGKDENVSEVQTLDTDAISVTSRALSVGSFAFGYDSVTDQWKRTRVTASGRPISGTQHGLVTAPGVYDPSGTAMRAMISPSSGSNALVTATNTPPTFVAYGDNYIPASGGIAFAMQYRSGGSTIVVKKIFITNLEPALVSGQYLRWDICRTSGLYSGATQITARPMDPGVDGTSGASLNIQQNVTGSLFPTAARDILFPWAVSTQGWFSGATGAFPQNPGSMINMFGQAQNIIAESQEAKELRMTSGFGFIIQQTLSQTGYTQVTSGRFGVTVLYTIQ